MDVYEYLVNDLEERRKNELEELECICKKELSDFNEAVWCINKLNTTLCKLIPHKEKEIFTCADLSFKCDTPEFLKEKGYKLLIRDNEFRHSNYLNSGNIEIYFYVMKGNIVQRLYIKHFSDNVLSSIKHEIFKEIRRYNKENVSLPVEYGINYFKDCRIKSKDITINFVDYEFRRKG